MVKHLYNWKRFWCPRTGHIDLFDEGYLYDPESKYGLMHNSDPVSFASIAAVPCLVLLGEPGIGKSHEMQAQYDLAKRQAADGGDAYLLFNLRDFQTDERLCRKVFEHPTFQSWRDGTHRLHLYLDSLDEGLLTITVLATLLTEELKEYPVDRLYLRIACRTAVWPGPLEDGLKRLWDDEAVKVYELAPLRRVDVQAAAQHHKLDADIFLREVDRRGAVPLAIKPVTLNFLLNTYRRNGQLPLTRTALYLDGCRLLCEEQNQDRKVSGHIGKLSAEQRLAIAARIAAVTVFANRSAIWTGIDQGDVPEEDVTIRALSGNKECVDGNIFPLRQADIEETLDTGLFSSRGLGRMGWAHQTYAEFLAAYYLQQHQTTLPQVMSLLVHADDTEGKIVPQLHETAAWLSGMIPAVFREVMRTDPEILLCSDVATADEQVRAAFVEHLLRLYDEGNLLDRDLNIHRQYHTLTHSGLAEQLRPYICDPTKGEVVRRVAIHIAEDCTLQVLQDNLADIALDSSQPLSIRVSAAYAICNYGNDQIKAKLKPLAIGKAGEDPKDKLKGCGFLAVWPKYITAEELFTLLTPPNRSHFVGIYRLFLAQHLVPHLKPSDLPVALRWVEQQPSRHQLSRSVRELSDAIMLRAWGYLDSSEVLEAFTIVALVRLKALDGIFGDRSDSSNNLSIEDDKKRRRVLDAMIPMLTDSEEDSDWPFLSHPRLVMNNDIPWMIERFQATRSIKKRRIWARWIERAFNLWTETDHLEVVFAAYKKSRIFAQRFAWLFNAVRLDSSQAQRMRADYVKQQRLENRAHNRPLLSPPPQERIARLLHECETGNSVVWWRLTMEMTLEPNSTSYGDEQESDLTVLPGWQAADAITRTRIVEAAKKYILEQDSESSKWPDKDIWYRPAVAGYKALRLLLQEAPDYISLLSREAWQKWAPIILTYLTPDTGKDEDRDPHRELVRLSYQHAPDEMIHSLIVTIDRENEVHGHIDIIRKLTDCWDNRLAHAVLEKINDTTLKPECMGYLLGELLEHRVVEAQAFAESLLLPLIPSSGDKRARAIIAARMLMMHTDNAGWSVIWPVMQQNAVFGREVVTAVVSSFAQRRTGIGTKLAEDSCADLYLWLIKQYSPAEDPQYESGKAHFMEERANIAYWRDALLQYLRMRGTPEACKAIHRIMEELPQFRDWLKWILLDAQNLTRRRTWIPPQPGDILKITSNQQERIVQSGDQLLRVTVESLKRLETELHGETPTSTFLWNEIGKSHRPKSENDLSDFVKNHLDRDLKQRGIIVNREVEIRRGQQTDIRVEAIVKSRDGELYDSITVIIEVKGCWHRELNHAMKTQLVDRYLKDNHCQHGLYLVGWFLCDLWDDDDYRKDDTPKFDIGEMQKQLDKQATELSQKNVLVKALVIDTTRHRV